MRSAMVILILIVFVIGGFVGWGLTNSRDAIHNTVQGGFIPGIGGGPGTEVTVTNLQQRLQLNNLLRDHSDLTSLHLQGIYDGKNISVTQSLIDDNTDQIVDFFASKFGENATGDFQEMWEKHIEQYVLYTNGLKNNNPVMMNQATQNLANMTLDMGNYFNQISATYSGAEVADMMDDHINLTLASINAFSDDDNESLGNYKKTSIDQTTEFALYLIENSPQ